MWTKELGEEKVGEKFCERGRGFVSFCGVEGAEGAGVAVAMELEREWAGIGGNVLAKEGSFCNLRFAWDDFGGRGFGTASELPAVALARTLYNENVRLTRSDIDNRRESKGVVCVVSESVVET